MAGGKVADVMSNVGYVILAPYHRLFRQTCIEQYHLSDMTLESFLPLLTLIIPSSQNYLEAFCAELTL